MPLPSLIAFDMDGTLIDTANLTTHDLVAFLAEYGIRMTYEHYLATYFGMGGPSLLAKLNADYGTSLDWDEFAPRRVARLPVLFAKGVPLAPGAEAVFIGLRTLGIPFCIATNSAPDRTEMVLDNLMLSDESLRPYLRANYHSAIDKGRRQKPEPDVFTDVATHYGFAPSACLGIEDGLPGMQALVASGFQSLGYIGLSQNPAREAAELTAAGATHLITHWNQFLPWLTSRK